MRFLRRYEDESVCIADDSGLYHVCDFCHRCHRGDQIFRKEEQGSETGPGEQEK